MQKIIYHLHDVCCNHSSLTLEDAVKYALDHGYKALYWTEHSPVIKECGYYFRRAKFKELTDLKNRINEINKKYKNKLHVYFGYEVEFNKPNRWFFERLARDPLCEFMIMGIHFYGDVLKDKWPFPYVINDTHTVRDIKDYLEMSNAAMESGLFSWAPHPEIWLNSYGKWDKHAIAAAKQIIAKAIKTKTPLGCDINFKSFETKSIWHYPSPYFWNLVAKTNIPVIIECDAHSFDKIKVEWISKCTKMIHTYGIKKNIVENIPIRWLPKKPLLVLYEDGLDKFISNEMKKSLIKNKVKFVKINSKSNLVSICKKQKVHPVWTLGLIKNTSILAKAKKTSMFNISDLKGSDLSLKQFSHMTYDQFLKKFIKEAKKL